MPIPIVIFVLDVTHTQVNPIINSDKFDSKSTLSNQLVLAEDIGTPFGSVCDGSLIQHQILEQGRLCVNPR